MSIPRRHRQRRRCQRHCRHRRRRRHHRRRCQRHCRRRRLRRHHRRRCQRHCRRRRRRRRRPSDIDAVHRRVDGTMQIFDK